MAIVLSGEEIADFHKILANLSSQDKTLAPVIQGFQKTYTDYVTLCLDLSADSSNTNSAKLIDLKSTLDKQFSDLASHLDIETAPDLLKKIYSWFNYIESPYNSLKQHQQKAEKSITQNLEEGLKNYSTCFEILSKSITSSDSKTANRALSSLTTSLYNSLDLQTSTGKSNKHYEAILNFMDRIDLIKNESHLQEVFPLFRARCYAHLAELAHDNGHRHKTYLLYSYSKHEYDSIKDKLPLADKAYYEIVARSAGDFQNALKFDNNFSFENVLHDMHNEFPVLQSSTSHHQVHLRAAHARAREGLFGKKETIASNPSSTPTSPKPRG